MDIKHFPATIGCDWGYAFDFLSIFEVKMTKNESPINIKNFNETFHHIAGQFNQISDFLKIYDSVEYDNLYNVNFHLFELVDKAKDDSVKASEVDAGVWNRYLAKKALQDKFFPDIKTNEQKIGYIK